MVRVHRPKDEEPIQRRQGDPTYVYMRAEDRSVWMKLAYLKDKYSIIWIPLFSFLVMLGFDFRTPAQAQRETRAHIDSATKALQVQIDAIKQQASLADSTRREYEGKIDILLRLRCIDGTTTPRDRIAAGLDCSKIAGTAP